MRDNVVVVDFGRTGTVVSLVRKGRRRPASAPVPTTVTAAHGPAVQAALRLVGGDPSRLRLEHDGSVTILNARRTPGVKA